MRSYFARSERPDLSAVDAFLATTEEHSSEPAVLPPFDYQLHLTDDEYQQLYEQRMVARLTHDPDND